LNHRVEQQNLDTKLYWTAKFKYFHNQLLHGKKHLVRKYMLYAAAASDFYVATKEILCISFLPVCGYLCEACWTLQLEYPRKFTALM
jgi:hypothetical protein